MKKLRGKAWRSVETCVQLSRLKIGLKKSIRFNLREFDWIFRIFIGGELDLRTVERCLEVEGDFEVRGG
jgi:hypothetical protein